MMFDKSIALVLVAMASSSTEAYKRLPAGLTWTNNAWGDENSKDTTNGMKVVDVDLFDEKESRIQQLKDDGHIVICYISTGTVEDWRDDYKSNKSGWDKIKGQKMDEWAGETWLDITKLDLIKPLMSSRFQIAKDKGCDGIEGDNVDCYQNNCVQGKSESDLKSYQIAYNIWQTEEAHRLGMSIGLKNSVGIIEDLAPYYDFGVNEECVQWQECDYYKHFIDLDKAVFGTEYSGKLSNICKEASKQHMMTKLSESDGWVNCFNGVDPLPATLFTSSDDEPKDDDDSKDTDTTPSPNPINTIAKKIKVPSLMTWTNNAWGDGNELDRTSGMKLVIVDLFDEKESRIQQLKQDGHIVICYISTGTTEDWRDDYRNNKEAWKEVEGRLMGDWPGETWLDIRKLDAIKPLMSARFAIAKNKGCDGIEGDNVDCYQNNCVDGQDEDDLRPHQIAYNIWQTEEAHRYGMIIGLKNSLGLVKDLVDYYDFAVNESCQRWNECQYLQPFEAVDKAIFGTEYSGKLSTVCKKATTYSMNTKLSTGGEWVNCFNGINPLPETEFIHLKKPNYIRQQELAQHHQN
eukprot:Awhi_evm1s102